ncbi:MAG: hypothetical protein J1E36_06090 [Eubacterium sp.]|nr:hypothetical protein [Eubacterium sp.]
MKKNKMMRLASVLLVAVLLTTSIISGTFAKYVTSGSASDGARVAKFGVTIAASGSLFNVNYFNSKVTNGPAGWVEDDYNTLLTVESSNGDKLVAPGTQNTDGLSFTISGAPEVDVLIKLAIEDGSKDIWLGQATYPDRTTAAVGDTFTNDMLYTPITYTLKLGNQTLVEGNLDAIKAYLANYQLYVDANTNMSADANYTYTLTWAWDFDKNGAGTFDKQDTLLGDIAAFRSGNTCQFANDGNVITEGTHYNVDTNVNISVSVTQVD